MPKAKTMGTFLGTWMPHRIATQRKIRESVSPRIADYPIKLEAAFDLQLAGYRPVRAV
jgi:hypothetical protein